LPDCRIRGLNLHRSIDPDLVQKTEKPSFAPPNRIFGPVWITLYTLMGISLYLILREGLGNPQVQVGLGIFGIQLVLNVIWSFVFFGKKSLLGGLVVIAVLWIAILLTIISFLNVSLLAGLLLVPYILWSTELLNTEAKLRRDVGKRYD